jgi:hypothetical protein
MAVWAETETLYMDRLRDNTKGGCNAKADSLKRYVGEWDNISLQNGRSRSYQAVMKSTREFKQGA